MIRDLTLGKRIKSLRLKRRMSRAEIARRAGVVQSAIRQWEDVGVVPRYSTMRRVAVALGVSELFLATGHDPLNPQPADVSASDNSSSDIPTPFNPQISKVPGGYQDIRSLPVIIDAARREIALVTGIPVDNVQIKVELSS